jgi:hypothetical protein
MVENLPIIMTTALAAHTLVAIATIILFQFQMAKLEDPHKHKPREDMSHGCVEN